MQKYLYLVNNYSGVETEGLKDSVYSIKEKYRKGLEVIEEDINKKGGKDNLKNFDRVLDINKKIFEFSDKIIKESEVPVVFAGDHSMAIGSISASSYNYDDLLVIWIDAHTDINDETTTPSGNIHGMPVNFLLSNRDNELSQIGGFSPKLKKENIIYLGLRSVDPGEEKIIQENRIKAFYYKDIQRRGLKNVLKEISEEIKKHSNIHVSFDFDSMGPNVFPAVSTPVEGGFTKEDVKEIFSFLQNTSKVVAVDLVEYNKQKDKDDISINFAIELLEKVMR